MMILEGGYRKEHKDRQQEERETTLEVVLGEFQNNENYEEPCLEQEH